MSITDTHHVTDLDLTERAWLRAVDTHDGACARRNELANSIIAYVVDHDTPQIDRAFVQTLIDEWKVANSETLGLLARRVAAFILYRDELQRTHA